MNVIAQRARTAPRGHKANPITALTLASLRQFSKSGTGTVARLDASNIQAKAAQPPADTGTSGWAAELVAESVFDFFEAVPTSVLGALVPYATRLNVQGELKVPGHVTPSQAAAFIGELLPVPTISGTIGTGATLRTDKLATIVLATRELMDAGAGADAMLESLLNEAIAVGADAVLLGSGAGSDTQPPGLGNGVVALPGSADAVADLKSMMEAAPTAGMVRPVWLLHPSQVIGATAANIVDAGAIAGAPIVASSHVVLGDVWLIDAADLLMNAGGAVDFMRTEEALVHADDVPLAIADEAGTLAGKVISVYQQGLVAVRAVLPIHWSMRDIARVVKLSGATW
ncbi:phage major capsid protein [Cupriavidus oxalaticus]|uniref:Phage major capsid protein n=1 Tax=Cupriavidus oxalaticus TaxID=96344 RepID=A0A5P3VEA1_9BURK|nr:phage major capsid protein [Cupriavidus oxalaticus]QEZ44724.1 hypothetical protein D2917_11080 [Cupriavidus oxalaticus]